MDPLGVLGGSHAQNPCLIAIASARVAHRTRTRGEDELSRGAGLTLVGAQA
jgi:hypothetical protein